jgi:glycosyltransferase involved in cell wall biosynthesis
VTSHGGDLFGLRGRLATFLKRRVAESAAAMTVVSNAMKQEAARLDLLSARLEVIPMGVDLRERFVPDANVQRDPSTLLFVGRLVAKKGLRHLLDAMPVVLAQRPDTALKIAGFGPEEQVLRAQAQRLGIDHRVQFLGAMAQQALPDLYRRASLFVAPFVRDESGNQEGLPVVLMEAIGCGCPIVVGNVAGLADLLGEAQADVTVDPLDIHALATAILRALEEPFEARACGEAIRASALGFIDWTQITARYASLIDIAMQQNAAAR